MQIARFVITSLLAMFIAAPSFAQQIELFTGTRLTPTANSARGAAMGGVAASLSGVEPVGENPVAAALLTTPAASLQFAQQTHEVFREFEGTSTGAYRATFGAAVQSGITSVSAALPLGRFVIAPYHLVSPRLEGFTPFAGSVGLDEYEPEQCYNGCNLVFSHAAPAYRSESSRSGVSVTWRGGPFAVGVAGELVQVREEVEHAIGFTPIGEFEPTRFERARRKVDASEVAWSGGLRWQAARAIAFTAAFRQGGEFRRDYSVCGAENLETPLCIGERVDIPYHFDERRPHTASVGATWTPAERLTIAAEVIRRYYGRMPTEGYYVSAPSPDDDVRSPLYGPFEYENRDEPHVGIEYVVGRRTPVALRAGWWRDPARFDVAQHSSQWTRDLTHLTYGLGVKLAGTDLSIAIDESESPRSRRASCSVTHAF